MSSLLYAVSSITWSVIGFVFGYFIASTRDERRAEAAVPNSTFVAWHGHRMTTQTATRIIGIIVLLLAISTVVQNTKTSHRLNEVTHCQATFNSKFADVSTLRAQLADQDREALQRMLLALYQQRNDDPRKRLRTFRQWVKTVERTQRQRELHPLPELPRGECR